MGVGDEEAGRVKLRAMSVDADVFVARLGVPESTRVVAEGSYSPDPAVAVRLAVFEIVGTTLRRLGDGWMRSDSRERLRALLPQAVFGSSDAMYATREKFVWAADKGELRLWNRGRLVLIANARGIEVRGNRRVARTARGEIARVLVDVDRGWSRHRAIVETSAGSSVVAAKRELAAVFDPTYDKFNLIVDADWASTLGKAVAVVLGVPCDLHSDLR